MVEDNTESDRDCEAMEQYVEALLEEIKALKDRIAVLNNRLEEAYELVRVYVDSEDSEMKF